MMLTAEELELILAELGWQQVYPAPGNSQHEIFRLQKMEYGYSSNPKIAQLQAKLSIMLEAAPKR